MPSVPPAPPAAALPAVDAEPAAAGGAAGSDDPIVGRGRWSENHLYRFRIERVAACAAPAPRPAAGGGSRFRGETSWVGALVDLEAKDRLAVSARDLELRRGGVILSAATGDGPARAGCEPRLPARTLRAGDSARGFAVFEVPKHFRAKTADPIVFSYQPTRWGGARRVFVPIPECFDTCPETPVASVADAAKTGKTAGRSRPGTRRNP